MTEIVDISAYPTWLREVDVALPSFSHVVLVGNINDDHLVPSPARPRISLPTRGALGNVLFRAGFRDVASFNPVTGIETLMGDIDHLSARVALILGVVGELTSPDGDVDTATAHLRALLQALMDTRVAVPVLVEGAARLAPGGEVAHPNLHSLMVTAEAHAGSSITSSVVGPHRARLHAPVVWLLEQPNELPAWFVRRREVRTVSVPAPTTSLLHEVASTLVASLPDAPSDDQGRIAVAERFANASAGLTSRALLEVVRVAIDQGIPADRVEDAVRMFRIGVPDNPWHDPALKAKIANGDELLAARVKGQPRAISKATDILIRSTTGLTGAQVRSSGSRPQGVLFFAGPTGVGKTELAKALAELVFGRDDQFIRFDMSEFSSEQSEARLIGSPPGYVGSDAGGELTNAIRERPFSVVLFDEIDKAHPRIMDKFLQILEDGRLTSGTGATVYFGEALIVFTSNCGVYRIDESGNRTPRIRPGQPYDELERSLLGAINEFFTADLGRPEILNRIGLNNVVVFDFITPDVCFELIELFLANVARTVQRATSRNLTWSDAVEKSLLGEAVRALEFGGRGVATTVETMLVNPLARALLTAPAGHDVHVDTIEPDPLQGWRVRLR